MQTAAKPFTIPDFLAHLALPALILGFGYVAIFMRYTRAAMLEVINSLYITTAESKGLPNRIVVVRHALRNALIPILSILGVYLSAPPRSRRQSSPGPASGSGSWRRPMGETSR